MIGTDRDILEKTARLAEENNKLLKKVHRSIVWGRAVRIIYWIILIGAALGAYYFIQPYIDKVLGVYDGLTSGIQKAEETRTSFPTGVTDIIDSFRQ